MNEPVRLQKIEEKSLIEEVDKFLMKHWKLGLIISLIILGILVTFLAYKLVGISATESGMLYNHLKDLV